MTYYSKKKLFQIFLHGYHFGKIESMTSYTPISLKELEKIFYEHLTEKELKNEKEKESVHTPL